MIFLLCLFSLELFVGFLSLLLLDDVLGDVELLDDLDVLDTIEQFMGRT